jgi:signal transduction histidine kinase
MIIIGGQDANELRHDARQTIATILILVAAGQQEVDDHARVLKRLDQVADQARVLASMIAEPTGPSAPAEVADVSAETTAVVDAVAAGYGGELTLACDTGAWVDFSPGSLRRVLTNILRNAVRAAGEDGSVRVGVARTDWSVVIEVEDDGPGFGHLPVIHGLGLRSSSRLVGDAGGRIEAVPGGRGGALVRVTLPLLDFSEGHEDEDLIV